MTRPLAAVVLTFLGYAILAATPLATPLAGAKHETWFEARSPNFIVVCNAGEKQARKTAIRLEQIRAIFRRTLTVANAHPTPLITVLAVRDEASMKALLPEYWTKNRAHLAGVFIHDMDQYFAAVQLDAQGSNPYLTIYHEYYHSLTIPYFPNLPVWLSEGLADFYGNTQISDSGVEEGVPIPELIAELKEERFIPLDVLFKVDHQSPYYNEQNKISVFYAESWALTHYLMVGDKASHKSMLAAYLDALSHGATPEQAAAKGFGDLNSLQIALQTYIRRQTYYDLKSGPPQEISASELLVRELSDADVDAYRGGFAVVRGRTQDAKPLLEEAVKLDPKSALGYEYLGFAEFRTGERAEAQADVNRAIELNSKNAMTRYLRARLESGQSGAVGDDAQMEDDLRTATMLSPEFAPPYGMLAVYLATKGQNSQEALAFAIRAVSLEPGNAAYQLDMAQVMDHLQRYDEARKFALRARADATAPMERAQAEQFLAHLQQEKVYSGDDAAPPESTTGQRPVATNSSGDSSQGAPQDSPQSSQGAPHPSGATDGSAANNLRDATGAVAKVSCMGGLKFELDTGDGKLTLHIKPGTNLPIRWTTRPAGSFNPCSALQGQRVRVTYQPDDANGKVGTLSSVTVLSGPGGDADGAPDPASGRRLGVGAEHSDPVTSSAEGHVTQILCNGNELTLNLDAGERAFILHARDATRVTFEQDVAFDAGDFQPCTQLKGHEVKIAFVTVEGKTYDGEIQGVEVEK
jgi:tetratricopeptide (TPR) repeat protein